MSLPQPPTSATSSDLQCSEPQEVFRVGAVNLSLFLWEVMTTAQTQSGPDGSRMLSVPGTRRDAACLRDMMGGDAEQPMDVQRCSDAECPRDAQMLGFPGMLSTPGMCRDAEHPWDAGMLGALGMQRDAGCPRDIGMLGASGMCRRMLGALGMCRDADTPGIQ